MSKLNVNSIDKESGSTLTLGGSGTTVNVSNMVPDVALSNRNLIINGAMNVAQRGTQTGQGGSNVYSAVDRWEFVTNSAARVTTSQDTSGLGNFSNTLKIDCTTADTSIAVSDQAGIRTKLESQDLQHLLWGTASAKTLTLRFTVSSPKAGIHCVQAYNRDAGYSYVQEFTVTSANTAEEFTVTIPGDTSNGFANDNGTGLEICFPLHNGTNWQTTSGSWQSGNFFSTSNQQNLLDDVANNFYLTGVQLEVGDTATPFEHRSYGEELSLCQRYFYKWIYTGLSDQFNFYSPHSPAQVTAGLPNSSAICPMTFPVTMRATPTVTKYGTWAVSNCSQPTIPGASATNFILQAAATSTAAIATYPNTSDDLIDASAEL